MKDQTDDRLAELLRRWAEKHAPTDGQIASLRGRVRSALAKAPPRPLPSRLRLPAVFTAARRMAWFFPGAAAAGVVAILLWPDATPEPGPDSSGTLRAARKHHDIVPPLATLTQDQLAAKAALWNELEDMFSGQLQWAAESDDKVAMGVSPSARPASQGRPPLAIRLVVVSREHDRLPWAPLWTVDVLTRAEEVVALAEGSCGAGRLLLWTYALPDGMVAIDGRIALADRTPMDLSFSDIQPAGTTKAVGSLNSGEVEYCVFQTVATVDGETG